MRHGKKFNHLGRTSPHRKAMLSNMASSLIINKRITTTVAKAKELRKYVEPLITKSKDDSTHSRRTVFSYLQNKDSIKVLFDEVAEKVASRPGGYTRIIRTGNRLGDNAEMCIIELVDYNELLLEDAGKKTKTRRSRRRGGKKSSGPVETKAITAEQTPESTDASDTKDVPATTAEEKDTTSTPSSDQKGETATDAKQKPETAEAPSEEIQEKPEEDPKAEASDSTKAKKEDTGDQEDKNEKNESQDDASGDEKK